MVCYNGQRDPFSQVLFAGLDPQWSCYLGGGFDMGAYQAVGSKLDCDLVVGMNSQIHFHRHGWLERIVEAHRQYPDALLGAWGSYENSPHIRGPFMAMPPALLRQYPFLIDSRANCHRAESGDKNFTQWVHSQGKPALMVTWDGIYGQSQWRSPANVFRKGDQSNCLVWDRHTLAWQNAVPEDKRRLTRSADGLSANQKSITVVGVTSIAPASHAIAINLTAASIPHTCRRLLISPKPVPGFDGEWTSIPEWMPGGSWTKDDMCRFLLRGLADYIDTDLAILVQQDGYAINPERWTDAFLQYDYIGAPWPRNFDFVINNPMRRVGNGGFSVRSSRWLEACKELPDTSIAEDSFCCVIHRNWFEQKGMKIAPLQLAMQWSMEHSLPDYPHWNLNHSFGFHGLVERADRAHLRLNPNE